jgi:circadian clock protein KaiC
MHLVSMHKAISEFKPNTVILDPISSFMSAGTAHQIKAMLVRLFDWLKTQQITGLVTCLTTPQNREETDVGISSLIDTWIEVRDLEVAGERNRALYLLKSRGMSHSNQVRELIISDAGVLLSDVFVGADGVLIGSAKLAEIRRREHEEREIALEVARSERLLELKRETLEARVAALRGEHLAHEEDVQRRLRRSRERAEATRSDRESLSRLRTESGTRGSSSSSSSSNGGRA